MEKMKCSQDGQSTSKKCLTEKNQKTRPIFSEEDCGFEFSDIVEEIAVNSMSRLKSGKAPGILILTLLQLSC